MVIRVTRMLPLSPIPMQLTKALLGFFNAEDKGRKASYYFWQQGINNIDDSRMQEGIPSIWD